MREHKYRFWHKKLEKYLEPGEFTNYGPVLIEGKIESEICDSEQFTGLTDNNGVDIYEGDVMLLPEHYEGDTGYTEGVLPVVFDDAEFMLYDGSLWYCDLYDAVKNYGAEVLGNIHEHRHLLDKEL